MSDIAKPVESPLEKQAIRKITWRLIPFLMLLYSRLQRQRLDVERLQANSDHH
jgi:hypothetical protein